MTDLLNKLSDKPNQNDYMKIRSVCLDGMNTDGDHHKQFALSEILRLLYPKEYDTLKDTGYDMGIPA